MPDTPFPSVHPARPHGDESWAAYSDPSLWSYLVDEASDIEFCSAWLQLMSKIISGVRTGVVVLSQGEDAPFVPVAVWPASGAETMKHTAVIERAAKERKGVVIRDGGEAVGPLNTEPLLCIAFPVLSAERIFGVMALRVTQRSGDALQVAMRQLQWGTSWIESRMLKREIQLARQANERVSGALEFVAGVLEEPRFSAAASSFATLLATRLTADRVSVGFVKGRHVKVRALSHSAQFKERMNQVRAVASAMDESLDQERSVALPAPNGGGPVVCRVHGELSAGEGERAICTVPFFDSQGRGLGAITLERPLSSPFTPHEIEFCEVVAAVVGPILEEKLRLDRPVLVHAATAAGDQLGKLFGRGHLVYKTAFVLLLALVAFFCVAKGDYRISARTTMEGSLVRAITAPYDGFIAEAPARPGDVVRKGAPLARLDDREKRLERLKTYSLSEQYSRQYREALANGDTVQMRVLKQQLEQARTQLKLLDEQLGRSRLTAPFDAVVLSGDLSQSLGAPVDRNKVLFEVAPLQDYRVRLHVDEQRVSDLKPGQRGMLVLNSLPDSDFPITVRKITPIAMTVEGKNQFLVEASLDRLSARIRPGMEGVGKIFVERRLLFWIWTHEMVDWLRLWAWSWLP
ncbi:HlyD family efflux transporter periplasmic adaptor subunit [Geomonas nitrogeniifigens]|uniref:HlyD family efflux transporter periplasmic adaptor subunit n=1 Tax=Geomonas diazotrophica TaxID=2843197 RepID=A0ABX8JKG3_9BACT|nr:HlyD family efflux transporter periplasmic adaptor subunit [Geomonas nitrogeniifigens]QWV97601.1 HlyD family efflux transporter periplasmic adaptor subunit [Geomonas nitrogeniifigens]